MSVEAIGFSWENPKDIASRNGKIFPGKINHGRTFNNIARKTICNPYSA
jgi:hypothetical protein